jgi:poly(beta-D-mannuronate) lyase
MPSVKNETTMVKKRIANNDFYNSDKLEVTGDQKYTIENHWNLNPKFTEETYQLSDQSELKGKATDGSPWFNF